MGAVVPVFHGQLFAAWTVVSDKMMPSGVTASVPTMARMSSETAAVFFVTTTPCLAFWRRMPVITSRIGIAYSRAYACVIAAKLPAIYRKSGVVNRRQLVRGVAPWTPTFAVHPPRGYITSAETLSRQRSARPLPSSAVAPPHAPSDDCARH